MIEWEIITIDKYNIEEKTTVRTNMDLNEVIECLNLVNKTDKKLSCARNLTPKEERGIPEGI
tara:strand:- start:611 stop:796 length:186 start_codon:yes stop_codon:yes gene_type:complete